MEKAQKVKIFKILRMNINEIFRPLKSLEQVFGLLLIVSLTNHIEDWVGSARIINMVFKTNYEPEQIKQAYEKLELLFNIKLLNISRIVEEIFLNSKSIAKHLTPPVAICQTCNINLMPVQSYKSTTYYMDEVRNSIITNSYCPMCFVSYNLDHMKFPDGSKIRYPENIMVSVQELTSKTSYSKNFINMMYVLMFKNAVSVKG